MLTRPEANESAEFYRNYIAKVPNGPLLEFLARQPGDFRALLAGITDAQAAAPIAPGKWSVKQIVGHISDTERVHSYRVLRFARGDDTELPGFEQDDYVREAGSSSRSLEDLLSEWENVRKSTLALLRSLPEGAAMRRGVANGNPITVRAQSYVIAGHAQHHYELLKAQLGS